VGSSEEMWEIFTFAKWQNFYYMAGRFSLVSLLLLFSHQIMSNPLLGLAFLPLHGLQRARLLSLPMSPGVCSNSCPLSQWCYPSHPLPSPFPFAFNLSQHQGLFQWALCLRWPKCWSFSFSNSPSNEYSGSVSFRINWFDLLAVQGTLKSLLQRHRSLNYPSWFFQNNPEGSYYYLHFINEKIYQED